jgi:hypothetical protein
MHVVPWTVLKQCVSGDAADLEAQVTLPVRVLRLLIEAALASQPFDERSYVAANPDVAEAMKQGKCASGRAHYLATGYFEGRETLPVGFDQAWYLQRYPDVAQAVQSGKTASALQHFRQSGLHEWRSPSRMAEADIARWRSAMAACAPAARQQRPAEPVVVPMRAPAAPTAARR